MGYLFRFLPFVNVFADGEASDTISTATGNVFQTVFVVVLAIIAGGCLFSLGKDGWQYIKGNGDASIPKIIGKLVLFVIIIAAAIFIGNYKSWATNDGVLGDTGSKLLNTVSGIGDELTGGGGGGGAEPPAEE